MGAKAAGALMVVLTAFLAVPTLAQDLERGRSLYAVHCLTCHQADGGGVPNFQPPLLDSPVVTGAAETLIRWTLIGTPGPDAPGLWANAMPGFTALDDDSLADILTYVRQGLGHNAQPPLTPVSPEQVAAERATL